MRFLEHIRDLNHYHPERFLPLLVGDAMVGQVKQAFAARLADWPEVFELSRHAVRLAPGLDSFDSRTAAVTRVIEGLRADGVIDRHHGEPYRVAEHFSAPPLLAIDRASVAYFGIRAYGQHLNGFVRDSDGIRMWVGRRSRSKPSFPGMLDQLVAGGLPYGIPLLENLAKESWEEAAIDQALAANAVAVGTVSYCCETDIGLKPDLLFNYDLELPTGFVPRANDGEMEEFLLLPLPDVAAMVDQGSEFKPNCNLVIMDFLIRHGVLTPEHPDYVAISEGLHHSGPY